MWEVSFSSSGGPLHISATFLTSCADQKFYGPNLLCQSKNSNPRGAVLLSLLSSGPHIQAQFSYGVSTTEVMWSCLVMYWHVAIIKIKDLLVTYDQECSRWGSILSWLIQISSNHVEREMFSIVFTTKYYAFYDCTRDQK